MSLSRSAVVIANEIRLKRSQHRGVFIVVEGRADRLFYERFLDEQRCKFVTTDGKEKLIEVLRILDTDGFTGVLGIMDVDFDRLEGVFPNSPNIVRGDCHDIEAMLIRSPALDRVLREFGSKEKIENFVIKVGTDIRSVLLTAVSPIGCLRWHSLRVNLNLRFDGLQFSRFVDEETLAVDVMRLITVVKNLSQRPSLDNNDLASVIAGMGAAKHDPWQLCNGHDLVSMLSIALRKTLGLQSAAAVEVEILERALRLAFEAVDFAASELHEAIQQWEQANTPFRVLS